MKNLLFIGIVFSLFSCSKDSGGLKDELIYLNKSDFYGKWYTKNDIDSTLAIFDENSIVVYIYERKTQNLLERIDLGGWSLRYRYFASWGFGRNYIRFSGNTEEYLVDFDEEYNTFSFKETTPKLSRMDLIRIREE